MNLQEIKSAVDAGKRVYWSNIGYEVIKDRSGLYLIVFAANNYAIGLTWRDDVTLNGKPEDFFIGG